MSPTWMAPVSDPGKWLSWKYKNLDDIAVEGISSVTGEFPTQIASNGKIFQFYDVIMQSEKDTQIENMNSWIW